MGYIRLCLYILFAFSIVFPAVLTQNRFATHFKVTYPQLRATSVHIIHVRDKDKWQGVEKLLKLHGRKHNC